MATDTIGARLTAIRTELRESSAAAMSSRLGLGVNTWRQLEADKNVPSGETLLRLVELGFDATWILTGKGTMRTVEHAASIPVDPGLMAAVVEMIVDVYKSEGARLTNADLGRLSIEKYAEIIGSSEAPEDYRAQTELARNRLKRLFKQSAPGSGKRSA